VPRRREGNRGKGVDAGEFRVILVGQMERPSWDTYFMRIAQEVSRRSTCLRRKVGAILVRDKRILATGYNGAPRGLPHCAEVGCLREQMNVPSGERHELCRGLHAEMNAIVQAACHGTAIAGSDLYSTTRTGRGPSLQALPCRW